jgi:NADH:ubiquinone oxidoreductase subunit F (NADH-binding)
MSAELLDGVTAFAELGDPHGVLLAGPFGCESYAAHLHRLGALTLVGDVLARVEDADLRGRGGGGFPFARKLRSVLRMAGRAEPFVVVNGGEGEPASRKDKLLLTTRPHLVLDGAAAAARLVGASTAVIHVHAGSTQVVEAVRNAIGQRWAMATEDPQWLLSTGPGHYVAGESSAVIAHLEGSPALPRWSPVPAAEAGYRGRPTLLSNAETYAHLALLARDLPWPAPFLVTVRGQRGPRVVEVVGPASIGSLLREHAGLSAPPAAVLLGGYAGSWVRGDLAWRMALEPRGCGLVAVLPEGACGLAETARIARWMGEQGAGQCGPCFLGLPRLADAMDALVRGRRGAHYAVEQMIAAVDGRGACSHPDGVARLVRSALDTFAAEASRHHKVHRRGCRIAGFPLQEEM